MVQEEIELHEFPHGFEIGVLWGLSEAMLGCLRILEPEKAADT